MNGGAGDKWGGQESTEDAVSDGEAPRHVIVWKSSMGPLVPSQELRFATGGRASVRPVS